MIRKRNITLISLNRNGYYSNMSFMKYGIITFMIKSQYKKLEGTVLCS